MGVFVFIKRSIMHMLHIILSFGFLISLRLQKMHWMVHLGIRDQDTDMMHCISDEDCLLSYRSWCFPIISQSWKEPREAPQSLFWKHENPSWVLHHSNLCISQNLFSIPLWFWISTYGLYMGHIWSTALSHALNGLLIWIWHMYPTEVK